VFASEGADGTTLRLHAEAELTATATGGVEATFTLGTGEQRAFVLEVVPEGAASVAAEAGYAARAFDTTLRFWRHWTGRCTHASRWPAALARSALALKLLTSEVHGAIAAAATFGLPEGIRGVRNWDYRYTWIRDGSLTASTLIDLGYHDEPRGFARWLRDRLMASADGQLQIMYGIDGRRDLQEEELDHLAGYRGSQPVRVGNGAYRQLQLDIYGEMLLFLERYDAEIEPIDLDFWSRLVTCVDWVSANWDREDEGVWEVRGGRRRFLYSRLMDWVALDRALRIAERRALPAPVARWREIRDVIHHEINTRFWDDGRRAYAQSRGSTTLDASCLLMPLVGFIGPRDPRWLSTLDAIGRDLVDDSLVYRYRAADGADGLAGGEGTFSMCTFWYVDCLARAGRVEEARLIFEKMLHYAGPAGLYAEELGATGEHLGNYPQAFTHLGLVGAARSLDAALDAHERRVFRG
jgi:GH15 family glucan-1,4-alpha-glucosidase